jgi:pimeloyl-ACP methyl ester carboxylesterase
MSICAVVSLLILHSTSALKFPSRGNVNHFNSRATLESRDIKDSIFNSDIGLSLKQTITIKRDLNHDFDDIPSPIFNDKPPLLFLPGLDGIGEYSSNSITKLNLGFDVWKMAIKAEDRSTFMEIAATVIKALDTFDKPVVLVGESFGGLLAAYVALRVKKEKITKLVLINPATSFDRTAWPMLVPLISNTGIAFPFVGLATLITIVPDLAQMQRYTERVMSTINSTETAVNVVSSLLKAGQTFTEILPADTLNWRVSKWFGPGNSIMEGKYSQIKAPTLILIGKNG